MTAASALSILSALVSIVKFWTEYMRKREWIEAGQHQAIIAGVEASNAAIAKAKAARLAARADAARGADPLSDDGFKRKD